MHYVKSVRNSSGGGSGGGTGNESRGGGGGGGGGGSGTKVFSMTSVSQLIEPCMPVMTIPDVTLVENFVEDITSVPSFGLLPFDCHGAEREVTALLDILKQLANDEVLSIAKNLRFPELVVECD
jgi:hypothetical protein